MPETAATVSTLGLPVIGGGGGGGSGDDDDDMGIPLLIDETLRFRDGRCSVLDGKGGLYSLGMRVVVNSIRDGILGHLSRLTGAARHVTMKPLGQHSS